MNILCLTDPPPGDFTIPPGIDLIEWRMDLVPLDLKVIRGFEGNWMATIRHETHGGQFKGNDFKRESYLCRALELGARWVDVEAEFPLGKLDPEKCVRSVHLQTNTTEEIAESFERLKNAPGAIKKWVRPTAFTEGLCEEEKALIADETPCVIIHSQAGGQWSRARPQGEAWNYLAMDDTRRSGEGQLTWAENQRLAEGPLFGIVGNPVAHSLSPPFHNRVRRALGLEGGFVKVPLEDTKDFFASDLCRLFDGFAVTMPHKQAVTEILSEQSKAVTQLKACNTLTKTNTGWKGDNTDYLSVKKIIEEKRPDAISKVAVIGCGGFGRAAALAAIDAGHPVTFFNRTLDRAKEWAAAFSCEFAELENINLADFGIVIQCTAAEMNGGNCPVDSSKASEGSLMIESIYGRETNFLSLAPNSCIKVRGAEVFQYQAEQQLALWSGQSIPALVGQMAMTL